MRERLLKICDSFMGKNFEIPSMIDDNDMNNRISNLQRRIDDARNLIGTTRLRLREFLREIQKISQNPAIENNISLVELYKLFLNKEKALYSSLNRLKKEDKLFHGYCWIPRTDKVKVDNELREIKDKNVNVEIPTFTLVTEHHVKPPSLFRNNDFTFTFQEIVNTYGIPSYKEVNPAVFACVTFPFLFGVMFGDMGHGFVLFLVGVFMCLANDFLVARAPGIEGIFKIRYLILLMGFFATFCGIVYNDFMAIPIFAFESCYDIHENPHNPEHKEATLKEDCVYPIGIDPSWYLAHNELTYMNSLKMKISVILGVMQMALGVSMKAFNAAYFQNKLDLLCEFVPQIILLMVLFGYMDLMIICKWMTDFTGRESQAPSVITNMINMALAGGHIDEGTVGIVGSDGFQQFLSIFFLLVALICVPWMLFVKPILIDKHNKAHAALHHDQHGIQL